PGADLAPAVPVPLAGPSVNWNGPFCLFVQVGQVCPLFSSLWFSPARSPSPPNFSVWLPRIPVRLSDMAIMGPEERDGYGPPLRVEKLAMVTVGIRFGISFPSVKM